MKLTYSTNHLADHYRQLFERSHDGDVFVLMFALDNSDKNVPAKYADLLPRPWNDIEKKLKEGQDVALSGAARGRRIILLAAPSLPRLERLIASTPLLKDRR